MRCIDLLVRDVNKQPTETTRMISQLFPYSKYGGSIIMTLKFHGRGKYVYVIPLHSRSFLLCTTQFIHFHYLFFRLDRYVNIA